MTRGHGHGRAGTTTPLVWLQAIQAATLLAGTLVTLIPTATASAQASPPHLDHDHNHRLAPRQVLAVDLQAPRLNASHASHAIAAVAVGGKIRFRCTGEEPYLVMAVSEEGYLQCRLRSAAGAGAEEYGRSFPFRCDADFAVPRRDYPEDRQALYFIATHGGSGEHRSGMPLQGGLCATHGARINVSAVDTDCDPATSCPAAGTCSVATCAFGVCDLEPAPGSSRGGTLGCDDGDYLTAADACHQGR